MHARPRALSPSARPNNLGEKYWQSSCSSPETNRHTALDKKIETDKAGFSIDTFTESCVRTNTTDETLGTTPTLTVVTERPDYIAKIPPTPISLLRHKAKNGENHAGREEECCWATRHNLAHIPMSCSRLFTPSATLTWVNPTFAVPEKKEKNEEENKNSDKDGRQNGQGKRVGKCEARTREQ